jgi:taurine dioxygenase
MLGTKKSEVRMNNIVSPIPSSNANRSVASLEFERLAPALGAVVHNLNLADDLPDSVIAAILDGLDEHQVLFFRDQTLTPAQQRDFARRFGELHVHQVYPSHETVPEIMVLEYDDTRKGHQNNWHTDVTFIETPPFGSILYADDVPAAGGDTIWASSYAAFEALSAPMRSFLTGLYAVHDFTRNFTPERFAAYGRDAAVTAEYEKHKPVLHPVIRTNPKTGRQGLFVNRSFTSHLEGFARKESDAILEFLYRHLETPEFQVRFHWTQGAVAFWDNRFTQHYAVSDYFPAHRRVRRATILGDKPV